MKKCRKTNWKVLAFAGLFALTGIFSAKVLKAGNVKTVDDNKEQATEAPAADTSAAEASSGDLLDFSFKFDGVPYKLPCDYKEFADNGWIIDADPASEINANTHGFSRLKKGDLRVSANVFNPTGNVQKVEDCKISEITVYARDNVDFELPKGITVASTADEIRNAYGKPSKSSTDSDYESLTYRTEEDSYNSQVEFYIYNDPSKNYISVQNMIIQEGDKSEASTEVPSYLASYKAPAELGTDPQSPVFELDGKLYRLPCPLTEFTDDGWVIYEKEADSIDAGNSSYSTVTITKNQVSVDLSMANFAKTSTIIENCAVNRINFERTKTSSKDDVPQGFVKFPSGLGLDFTPEDLKSKLTGFAASDSNKPESGSYNYNSSDYNITIRYYYYNSDNYASWQVDIKNDNWDY